MGITGITPVVVDEIYNGKRRPRKNLEEYHISERERGGRNWQ